MANVQVKNDINKLLDSKVRYSSYLKKLEAFKKLTKAELKKYLDYFKIKYNDSDTQKQLLKLALKR